MAFLTLTQMLNSIPDGGANTAADMRAIIEDLIKSKIWAPYSIDHAEDIWWQGDFAGLTEIEPTGTSVGTEHDGSLSVLFSGQAANDLTCYVKARTFSIGDTFATRIRSLGSVDSNHTMAALCFTDGTATTSNIVAFIAYLSLTDNVARINTFHGTVTAVSTAVIMFDIDTQLMPWQDGIYLRLRYSAANTFQMAASPDGRIWSAFGALDISKTMTPTHFGVAVSKWGGTGDGIANFGPVCRLA